MNMSGSFSGIEFSDRYRTIPESQIIKMLMLAGWAYEKDGVRAAAVTRQSLNQWIAMGLGVRADLHGERRFNPVEVVNVLKRLGLEGRDPFWSERYVGTGRRLVTDLSSSSDTDKFIVHFRRTFNLRTVPAGKGLRLRVPLPLKSVHGEGLDVRPFAEGSPAATLSVSEGRLEARLVASGQESVTVGARLSFSAQPPAPDRTSPASLAPYLKPRDGLVVISNRVNELARSLAPRGANALSTIRAFWNYMLDDLNCGAIHYDQVRADAPCDVVLETGWYDCQLGSALFIALCRARGIPARLVSGHVLYRRAPTNHYWAEVWLGEMGWTPFDFLSWDLSLGGRDPLWRDTFYGRIDSRMITQLLPFEFTGSIGVTIPVAWHILQIAKDGGVDISLVAADGEPVYSDLVSIAV